LSKCDIRRTFYQVRILGDHIMSEKLTGTVKWFNTSKGYGFIAVPGQKDIFVHYLDIRSDGFKNLSEGQQVEFIPVESSKGLRATEVHVIDKEKKE